MNNANQELDVVMFHRSYHFVQELYFTRYLFCAFCICHVVETMCTSSLQKRRKKVLASNFQPALWAITTYNSLLTPDWHEYPHFVPTQDVCGYSIP